MQSELSIEAAAKKETLFDFVRLFPRFGGCSCGEREIKTPSREVILRSPRDFSASGAEKRRDRFWLPKHTHSLGRV